MSDKIMVTIQYNAGGREIFRDVNHCYVESLMYNMIFLKEDEATGQKLHETIRIPIDAIFQITEIREI